MQKSLPAPFRYEKYCETEENDLLNCYKNDKDPLNCDMLVKKYIKCADIALENVIFYKSN